MLIDRIVQLPDVRERMAGEGMEPAGGSPERFREVLKSDIAKWQKVVNTAGIKLEADFLRLRVRQYGKGQAPGRNRCRRS